MLNRAMGSMAASAMTTEVIIFFRSVYDALQCGSLKNGSQPARLVVSLNP